MINHLLKLSGLIVKIPIIIEFQKQCKEKGLFATDMQLIAGRLCSNTQQTGEILVNGIKQTLAFGTSVRKKGYIFIVYNLHDPSKH